MTTIKATNKHSVGTSSVPIPLKLCSEPEFEKLKKSQEKGIPLNVLVVD